MDSWHTQSQQQWRRRILLDADVRPFFNGLTRVALRLAVAILCGLAWGGTGFAEGPLVGPTSGNGLEWDAVAATDLKEYRVYLRSSPTVPYDTTVPFAVVTAPATGQSFSGTVQPLEGQNYVVVTARDLAGNESAFSNEIAFVFDKAAPPAPVIRLLFGTP